MLPDPNRPFQIESDASKAAYGAVLTQEDKNGARHPCAFLSKSFTPPECNYEIYDRELLGIIRALEEWRHYIQGSPHKCSIRSQKPNLLLNHSKPQPQTSALVAYFIRIQYQTDSYAWTQDDSI